MAILDDFFATLSDSPQSGSAGPSATSGPVPVGADRVELGTQIYNYFVSKGLAPHQAAAIAGNMAWEGGGRTDLVNPGDNVKHSPGAPHSIGIAQWNDRSPALIEFARKQGINIPAGDLRDANYARTVAKGIPLQTQLEFAWNEMQGPEKRAFDRISAGTDVNSAAAGAIGYHRPAGWTPDNPTAGHGYSERVALANQIMRAAAASPQPPDGMDASTYGTAPAEAIGTSPVAQNASPDPADGLFGGSNRPFFDVLSENTKQSQPKSRLQQLTEDEPSAQESVLRTPLRRADITSIMRLLQNRKPLGVGGTS